ncbi:MAG: DMT family transporter [Actinomycetota bacterium]|nr:DMT family transporter [Actinomycetota bacterium]
MSRALALICTLLAGGVVALQPPANAALAEHVGDLGAAFLSAVITVSILALLLVLAGHPARLSGLGTFKPVYALGGLAGAGIVAVSLIAVRPLGAGGVTALLVAAQLVVSVIADRLGWFGLHHVGLGAGRLLGLVLVIAGTVLVTRG